MSLHANEIGNCNIWFPVVRQEDINEILLALDF